MKRAIVFLLAVLPVAAAEGQDVTTRSLQIYGLGTLACAAYSPDGKHILTGGGLGAFLWNVETGEVVRMFLGHSGLVSSVAFSPDGSKVLTGSWDGTAKLWSAADGQELRTFSGHFLEVASVAFSPDGTRILTASYDRTAKLWDASDGRELRTFSGHVGHVTSVAFSSDGTKAVTGSRDATARLWDVSDGRQLRTFSSPMQDDVNAVAISPDGSKIVTGTGTGEAGSLGTFLWDAATGQELWMVFGHTSGTMSVAFSPDGTKILTGSHDGLAMLWNTADGTRIRMFVAHPFAVASVAFLPDGSKILTGSWDNTARLWNAADGTVLRTFFGHTYNVPSVAFSPDGSKVLTASQEDRTARLWDVANGQELWTFSDRLYNGMELSSVAFSPDGTKVLTGSLCIWGPTFGGEAKLWDASDGRQLREFSGLGWGVTSVAFSPDGLMVLTGSQDCTARMWNAADATLLRTFSGHTGYVTSVAFSPDGTKVLAGGSTGFPFHSGVVKLWDASDGRLLQSFAGHPQAVASVAFSPDGTKVLTGSWDGTAKLWDTSDGRDLQTFSGHTDWVSSVAFSPDGSRVLTGSADRTVRLWDASDGTRIRIYSGHSREVNSVAFSPDGTKVLTGSVDGTARLWQAASSGDKVILVAGGGNYAGNLIASQTQALADRAFFTFSVRGYKRNEIRYLSAFDDWPTHDSNGDGEPDADAYASAAAFWSAVDSWSSDTGRLLVYLINHGTVNTQTGEHYFLINPTESIKASELDSRLDALQSQTGGEVILVVDCCFSGGFVQQCAGPRRVVMSATTAQSPAIYSPPIGAESFSFYFLSSAVVGNSFDDCYRSTKMCFAGMGYPAGQQPWMDDNGDGISDTSDGALAARQVGGRYPAFGLAPPRILDVATTPQVAQPGEIVSLSVQLDEAVAAKEVWAVIPERVDYTTTEPVTDLTRVVLSPGQMPNRWEGACVAPRQPGEYTITYFAMSEDPLRTRLVATPVASGLLVHRRTSADVRWEMLE